MAKLIDSKFEYGDIVYLKTDMDQLPRIVFALRVFKEAVLYELACGTVTSVHYDFELSKEKNVVNAL